jgi:hypothetical protein
LNQEKALQGRQFAALRISQPQREPSPASDAGANMKGRKDAGMQSTAPRYLEFTISTLDIKADPSQPVRSAADDARLLGALDAAPRAAAHTSIAAGEAR